MDFPGHVNFKEESIATLKIADGAFLGADATEGVLMSV